MFFGRLFKNIFRDLNLEEYIFFEEKLRRIVFFQKISIFVSFGYGVDVWVVWQQSQEKEKVVLREQKYFFSLF